MDITEFDVYEEVAKRLTLVYETPLSNDGIHLFMGEDAEGELELVRFEKVEGKWTKTENTWETDMPTTPTKVPPMSYRRTHGL